MPAVKFRDIDEVSGFSNTKSVSLDTYLVVCWGILSTI